MKKILLIAILAVLSLGKASAVADKFVDRIWDDSTGAFTYEHTVRGTNALKIDTKKYPLNFAGNLADNGNVYTGGLYILTENGASFTIKDNGSGLAVGDSVKIILGNAVALGATGGAIIASENGHKLQAATSPYTANGTDIQSITATYLGATTGYRLEFGKSE